MYSLINSKLVDKILDGLNEPIWNETFNPIQDKTYFQRVTEYGIEFEMFVPGLTKKDVSVELEDSKLIISANYESELTSYSTNKSFTISNNIDSKVISASVENGVLRITLPYKKKEEKQKTKIQIL